MSERGWEITDTGLLRITEYGLEVHDKVVPRRAVAAIHFHKNSYTGDGWRALLASTLDEVPDWWGLPGLYVPDAAARNELETWLDPAPATPKDPTP